MQDALKQTIIQTVREKLKCSAHDLNHVFRVYNMCLHLAKYQKNVDMDILEAAALLHDIARTEEDTDNSGSVDHAVLGGEFSYNFLIKLGLDEAFADNVRKCIISHRYRSDNPPLTKEAQILFDADKLDIIGAIGLCRSYMIASEYKQNIYYHGDIPTYLQTNSSDGTSKGRIIDISKHSPNIEYELKFKNIPNLMHTSEAKKIALKRVAFMEAFFLELDKEII